MTGLEFRREKEQARIDSHFLEEIGLSSPASRNPEVTHKDVKPANRGSGRDADQQSNSGKSQNPGFAN